jgi:hypothetical protein
MELSGRREATRDPVRPKPKKVKVKSVLERSPPRSPFSAERTNPAPVSTTPKARRPQAMRRAAAILTTSHPPRLDSRSTGYPAEGWGPLLWGWCRQASAVPAGAGIVVPEPAGSSSSSLRCLLHRMTP